MASVPSSLRVLTLNLWGAHSPLDRRLEHAARGISALAPDVVLLQEVRVGEDLPNTAETLAARLGAPWSFAFACATRGEAGVFGPGSTAGEEGLAILSRHPLHGVTHVELPDARPTERRILLSGRIDVGGQEVFVHSTHLHWRLADGLARERQVVAVDEAARAMSSSGLHVLGGDFNAAPDCDEIRFMRGRCSVAGRRTSWQDAFARARPDERGLTWARRNPYTAELAWLELDRRIDYLFVSPERPSGCARVLGARVVLDAPAEDGVWVSDHFGVMAEIGV